MKKSTLLLIILVAIFFTSTLYLLFLNFQKPKESIVQTQIPTAIPTKAIDPTANWKTYTNDIYGFSFQYDNTKHLLETSGIGEEALRSFYKYYGLNIDSNLLILWKGLKTTSLPEESITMHFNADQLFSVQIFNNNLSPEEFVKKLCESEYGPNYLKNSGFKKININGQVLYYFNSGGIGQGTFNYVFFDKNKIVSFNTHEPSITYETNPEFAQILSTFKFTSPDYLLEDGSTYRVIDNYLSWDNCGSADNETSLKIKQKISALAQVSEKEINGLKIISTITLGFTSAEIKQFYLCQAGAFSPLKVLPNKILWISSCGTGAYWDGADKCVETRTAIQKLYKL